MTASQTIAHRAELACRLAELRDRADVARWEDDGGTPAPAPGSPAPAPMDSSEGFGYWPGEDDDMRHARRRYRRS